MSQPYQCDNPVAHPFHAVEAYRDGKLTAMHCEGYPNATLVDGSTARDDDD